MEKWSKILVCKFPPLQEDDVVYLLNTEDGLCIRLADSKDSLFFQGGSVDFPLGTLDLKAFGIESVDALPTLGSASIGNWNRTSKALKEAAERQQARAEAMQRRVIPMAGGLIPGPGNGRG